MGDGAIAIDPSMLAVAACLILVNAGASFWLGLGLERRLLVATVRSVVQLTLLGYLLLPVFNIAHPGLVLLLGLAMIGIAAREALQRTSRRISNDWLGTFLSLTVAAGATLLLGTQLIGVDPWYNPRYLIPMLGMVLGNALTGISLGLEACLRSLDEDRGRVEACLALGSTWWEAARPVAADAIRTGLVPIINTMSIVGLVSIPGMMTGQLLGGTSPEQAARYQLLILFMIAAATAAGCVGAVLVAVRRLFDSDHRLRLDRMRRVNL